MSEFRRPVPVADERSQEFWRASGTHTLKLARCGQCAQLCHPPSSVCPNCGSADPNFTYAPVEPTATIRSWTVIRQSFLPGFDVPFVLVDCELSAQADLRLIGRLLDGPDVALQRGGSVRVAFEDIAPGVSVLAFTLTDDS